MIDPADAKTALRAELRARRRALAAANPDAARLAAEAFDHAGVGLVATAALYHPAGGEIDPRPLGERLAALGAAIALPVVVAKDAPLVFRLADGAALAPDALGVLSPGPAAPTVRPGLIITPLLGFDRFGGRIGQGGGYYDRTLEALRRQGDIRVIGLAYADQEVDRLPMGPFDQRLDGVLTERGYRPAEIEAS